MRFERARSSGGGLAHRFNGRIFVQHGTLASGLDLCTGDLAGAQQHRLTPGAVDDGGLDTHIAFAAVQNQQVSTQLGLHVRCRGRAHAAKPVGTGGRDALHTQGQASGEQCLRYGVRGATQTDRVLPARRCRGHTRLARQDQGEGPRPKCGHQALRKLGHLRGKQRHLGCAGHMHDQRVIGRAPFGLKNTGHSRIVGGVGGQAIHGFGGHAHQLASLQSLRGPGNGLFICRKDHGPP